MTGGLGVVCDVDLGIADATRTHTVEVARWFAKLGFELELVARGPDPELVDVRYHDAGNAVSTPARLWAVNVTALRVLIRSRRGARRCYVRHEWGQVPLLAAARMLGYSIVTQVDDLQYGAGYEGRSSRTADLVRRTSTLLMGKLATGIVAITPGIRDALVHDYRVQPRRIEVLPNGVDLDLFKPQDRDEAIRRAGLDPGLRYVVFTGRFADWVEFETMLRAFAVVVASRPDARLVLVGDGPRRADVERLIAELELAERVVLTGFVRERERVRDLVGAASVCLVAHWAPRLQRIGTSPTKVAEYFASGRAVVALALPGVRELIEDAGAGVVVANDPAAMADAIGGLLDEPSRAAAAGAAGRRAAEERLSWESVVRRTIPLFELGRAAPGAR